MKTITNKRNLPDWIKIDFKHNSEVMDLKKELRRKNLHTVCEEARCPNLSECFGSKKTATFMIMGEKCSRNCAFCNVNHQPPDFLDPDEPRMIAEMVRDLKLNHAVITSVTRDDLTDGGSDHFVRTIREIRKITAATIEVLTPDFKGNENDRMRVSAEKPEIFNHNIETVTELYSRVRPEADYKRSLSFLKGIKKDDRTILSKSGIMVGLGETDEQLKRLLHDLAETEIDIFTCGQYLRPSKSNIPVENYLTPDWFQKFTELAKSFGIKYVYASPFTRSSYNAGEIISAIRKAGV
jgi:lipoic acid synthetase